MVCDLARCNTPMRAIIAMRHDESPRVCVRAHPLGSRARDCICVPFRLDALGKRCCRAGKSQEGQTIIFILRSFASSTTRWHRTCYSINKSCLACPCQISNTVLTCYYRVVGRLLTRRRNLSRRRLTLPSSSLLKVQRCNNG